jgi:hypothetical protein
MNVQPMATTQQAAWQALREYKKHRDVFDARDWEIERIYRAISLGKTVISVTDAIRGAGVDERARPMLAIARADDPECFCFRESDRVRYSHTRRFTKRGFDIAWHGMAYGGSALRAIVPRIPPQHRPRGGDAEELSPAVGSRLEGHPARPVPDAPHREGRLGDTRGMGSDGSGTVGIEGARMSEFDEAARLYSRMRIDELLNLKGAFELDRKLSDRPETIAFCDARLALIATELERRGSTR